MRRIHRFRTERLIATVGEDVQQLDEAKAGRESTVRRVIVRTVFDIIVLKECCGLNLSCPAEEYRVCCDVDRWRVLIVQLGNLKQDLRTSSRRRQELQQSIADARHELKQGK